MVPNVRNIDGGFRNIFALFSSVIPIECFLLEQLHHPLFSKFRFRNSVFELQLSNLRVFHRFIGLFFEAYRQKKFIQ